jgi:hypothetical protein
MRTKELCKRKCEYSFSRGVKNIKKVKISKPKQFDWRKSIKMVMRSYFLKRKKTF